MCVCVCVCVCLGGWGGGGGKKTELDITCGIVCTGEFLMRFESMG